MKNILQLKEEIKSRYLQIENYEKVITLFSRMIHEGLADLNCDDVLFYDHQIAFEPKNENQLVSCRRFIKKFCPNWKDKIYLIDNIGGDQCLIRYSFKGDYGCWNPEGIIKIWFQCTLDTVPKSLTKNGSCGFVERPEERKDNTQVFVCKKKPEDKSKEEVPF